MATRTPLRFSVRCFRQLSQAALVPLFLFAVYSAASPANNDKAVPASQTMPPAPPTRQTSTPAPASLSAASQMLQRQGLVFIENRGQFDPHVKFLVKGNGANLWLTNEGIVFDFQRPIDKSSPDASTEKRQPSKSLPLGRRTSDPLLKSDQPPMERLVFKQKLVSSNPNPTIEARDPQPGIYNYFLGSDPNKWRTHVLAYKEVVYRDIWKGIDLKMFANGENLEEEFVVHPGADARAVRLAYEGIEGLSLADDGSLKVATAFGDVLETSPSIYQEVSGKSVPLSGSFKVGAQNSYAFQVAKRDERADLIIDPTIIYSKQASKRKAGSGNLLYSTYLGGSGGSGGGGEPTEYATGVAVDSVGSAYVTGVTGSTDFPVTPGAFQTNSPESCSFVTKFSPLGDYPAFSTYLCGPGGTWPQGIAVGSAMNAYVTGYSNPGFPTTPNALQQSVSGAFLAVLSPAGDALVYSTGFGSVIAYAIAVDSSGRAYITGTTNTNCPGGQIPTTSNAFQSSYSGCRAAFLGVLDPSQSGQASLVYGSYLGGLVGSDREYGQGVAVDAYGMAYVGGFTYSQDFPVTPSAFQTTFGGGGNDAFLTKFNPYASTGPASVLYSTYIGGGADDYGYAVAVDSLGNAVESGITLSSGIDGSKPFPTTPGAIQPIWGSWGDYSGFVTKMNAAGNNLVFSTYWGGADASVRGVATDAYGNSYIAGYSAGLLLVTPNGFQQQYLGGHLPDLGSADAFIGQLDTSGNLLYSSYLGGTGYEQALGIAVDAVGDAYVSGWTTSSDFPTTPLAFQPAINPGGVFPDDAFVTKFPIGTPGGLSITAILPNQAGNCCVSSPFIIGTGFHAGATVSLAQGENFVPAQSASVGVAGRTIATIFDLTGAFPGAYDVVVTNPDGSRQRLLQGFTILQGGAPTIWVQILGPLKFRLGVEALFFLMYGNNGTADAFDVPLWMSGFPNDATLDVQVNPPPSSFGDGIIWSAIPPIIQAGTQQEISGMVNRVPIYQSGFFPIGVTFPRDGEQATLNGWTNPFYNLVSLNGVKPQGLACSQTIADDIYYDVTSINLDPSCSSRCLQAYVDAVVKAARDASRKRYSYKEYYGAFVKCLLGCMHIQEPDELIDMADDMIMAGLNTREDLKDCFSISSTGQANAEAVSSYDPNSLSGALGVGQPQWTSGSAPLPYQVSFGNDPGASAPAQRVVITDTLASNLDWSTLSLKDISFTGLHVPIPPTFLPLAGLDQFTTNVDLRPVQNLFVLVTVSLNPSTGLLTCQFQSIDPTTGLPPTDPEIGFLPPGGNGDMVLTVMSRPGLPTGTQVSDQATIVFDNNPPQSTNIWSNTLDNTPPTSHVTTLPGTELCPNFTVQWSGTDIGAGIQDYTIYTSDNGGAFTAWQTNTTATSAVYSGQVGHSYGFYSIARDLVGNVEPGKTSAETTTRVNKGTICGPVGPPTVLGGLEPYTPRRPLRIAAGMGN